MFCFKSFHRDTDRRVVSKFREISPTKNRWPYNKKISPGSPAVATARIAPKICQPPIMCSEFSGFHSHRFTFGGVSRTREHRQKKMCRKVNPIFGWSSVSSRILKTSWSESGEMYFYLTLNSWTISYAFGETGTVGSLIANKKASSPRNASCSCKCLEFIATTILLN